MNVPHSFLQSYHTHAEILERIRHEVVGIINDITANYPGANFGDRIKEPESLFLKALTGKYDDPFMQIDDFLACFITVPTLADIKVIAEQIKEAFTIVKTPERTFKPHEFPYSDLHLILRLNDTNRLPDKTLLNYNFELQIKTLLQEAWWRVDHDIVYKGRHISWGQERISKQLRALLDLADGILAQLEKTGDLLHAQAQQAHPDYKLTESRIIELMVEFWDRAELPEDHKRAADITMHYLDICEITVEDLRDILKLAKDRNDPLMISKSIPPLQQIFVLLFNSHADTIKRTLEDGKRRVILTHEMIDLYPKLKELDKGTVTL